MKRIAVLSDIHGNVEALRQIEQKLLATDAVIFLGDLFTGGDFPKECFELLKRMNVEVWIKGNTDEWVDMNFALSKLNDLCLEEAEKARSLLDKKVIDDIFGMDTVKTVIIENLKFFCIHDFEIENSSNFFILSNKIKDINLLTRRPMPVMRSSFPLR